VHATLNTISKYSSLTTDYSISNYLSCILLTHKNNVIHFSFNEICSLHLALTFHLSLDFRCCCFCCFVRVVVDIVVVGICFGWFLYCCFFFLFFFFCIVFVAVVFVVRGGAGVVVVVVVVVVLLCVVLLLFCFRFFFGVVVVVVVVVVVLVVVVAVVVVVVVVVYYFGNSILVCSTEPALKFTDFKTQTNNSDHNKQIDTNQQNKICLNFINVMKLACKTSCSVDNLQWHRVNDKNMLTD